MNLALNPEGMYNSYSANMLVKEMPRYQGQHHC